MGGTGAGGGSMLVGTFVQREICGTDSSCLPTTVGQVEREREREMRLQLNEGAERRRGKGGRGVQDRRGALAKASSSSRTFLIKLHFRLGNFL